MGFKHKTILCMPIKNSSGQIIGVIQVRRFSTTRVFRTSTSFFAFCIHFRGTHLAASSSTNVFFFLRVSQNTPNSLELGDSCGDGRLVAQNLVSGVLRKSESGTWKRASAFCISLKGGSTTFLCLQICPNIFRL